MQNYEPDGASVGVKDQGMDLHTQRCHVFLLKLTSNKTTGLAY